MNKISKNEIENFLEQKYEILMDKYNPTRILGIFITGPINYGYAESFDDAEVIAIYLPTFEDLCCKVPAPREFNGIQLLDIRHIYKILSQHELTSLELLFTDYYIISNKYKNLFQTKFRDNREKFARISPYERIYKTAIHAYEAFEQGNYFEAVRLQIGADLYVKNYSCEKCFHPTAAYITNYLQGVKDGNITVNWEDFKISFDNLIDAVEDTPVDKEGAAMLKNAVINLCGAALYDTVNSDATISALTKTEKKAFEYLRNEIPNGNGVISISKIIEKTGISRPVWKNLFQKLESEKIISTTNMGVKGTEIKILDGSLI